MSLAPCPCCGHLTLDEPGQWAICAVCFWEDDGQDDRNAERNCGGPNKVSLIDGRRNYLKFGVAEMKDQAHVRAALPDEPQHRWFGLTSDGEVVETLRVAVLPGLPPYGPPARHFGASNGSHEEGFVVRFTPHDGRAWTGNFHSGGSGLDGVYRHPDGFHALVFSSGQGFVVDPFVGTVKDVLDGGTSAVLPVKELEAVALADDLALELLQADGRRWRTERIAWDEIRDLQLEGLVVSGEALSPHENRWYPFSVDLVTREITGGSFH